MAAAVKAKPAAKVAKVTKVVKAVKKTPTAPIEEPKSRGKKRDPEKEAAALATLLDHVTIEGDFPTHRVKGIGEGADAAGIDSVVARGIIDRHLAAEAGYRTPSAKAISDARLGTGQYAETGALGWGVIEAMFNIGRSGPNGSHALFDSIHGDGAHSRMKLYGQSGAERIRPESEAKPKTPRAPKSAEGAVPLFNETSTKDDIVARLDGKKVNILVEAGGVAGVRKVTIARDSVKVGISKGNRVVKYTDEKGNGRTTSLSHFVK